MTTKFGFLIDFGRLKAAISTNAKPEIVLLRFGRHMALSRWWPRPLNTVSGFAFVDIAAFRRAKFMSKPRMCQYPGMLCYILWIQKYILYACKFAHFYVKPLHTSQHWLLSMSDDNVGSCVAGFTGTQFTIDVGLLERILKAGRAMYGIVARFNVPLDTLQVISETIFRVTWPNQQCHSTEGWM